jgi:hypothetical protein
VTVMVRGATAAYRGHMPDDSLCDRCAATIDHDTEALLEREHFDGTE